MSLVRIKKGVRICERCGGVIYPGQVVQRKGGRFWPKKLRTKPVYLCNFCAMEGKPL